MRTDYGLLHQVTTYRTLGDDELIGMGARGPDQGPESPAAAGSGATGGNGIPVKTGSSASSS